MIDDFRLTEGLSIDNQQSKIENPTTTHHSLARFNVRLCVQMAGVSILFLVVMHVFVRAFVHWSP